MFQTAILVLLYNKEISESKTLSSLSKLNVHYPRAKLVIWNNGPKPFKKHDCTVFQRLGYDVVIQETLNNESLAIIYNEFLANNEADKYVLLDDDSVLNESYVLASSKCNMTEVGMPIISAQGIVQSPTIDGLPYSSQIEFNSKCKVLTIGSGLVVGKVIVDKLSKNYSSVFDERFYLYGVDTTFCMRLFERKLTEYIKVIPGFNHSLSRLEQESIKTIKFRRLERSYDHGLTLRYYYPLLKALYILLRTSASTIKRMLYRQQCKINLFSLLKAFVFGRHYRQDK